MKAYILTVLVIDHDELGPDSIKANLEEAKFASDCISPQVQHTKEYDIGPWDDDHPLNRRDTDVSGYLAALER
jgi:hypothetical protein